MKEKELKELKSGAEKDFLYWTNRYVLENFMNNEGK